MIHSLYLFRGFLKKFAHKLNHRAPFTSNVLQEEKTGAVVWLSETPVVVYERDNFVRSGLVAS